jgi:hypothetical protein
MRIIRTALAALAFAALSSCGDSSTGPKQAPLLKVIGDIEWGVDAGCQQTLPGANSIVPPWLYTATADTFTNLVDTTGAVTRLSFAFDSGGNGIKLMYCNANRGALEREGIAGEGAVFIKPWHIAGLIPGGTSQMTFTGGGYGMATLRIFADADGDGAIEPAEAEDKIGLGSEVETRTFTSVITADATGVIRGEFWGGSDAGTGYGLWCGWSIVGAPR